MFNNVNVNDNYCSHKEMWEKIKDFLPSDKKIWSPFYCDGKQKDFFKELGFDIIHEDKDFFDYEPDNYGYIVDNPPFSLKRQILARLKELDKPFIIAIMPIVLSCKWFMDIFTDHIQILIPKKRPKCYNTHLNKPYFTPPMGMWYICYKMNFEKDLQFI